LTTERSLDSPTALAALHAAFLSIVPKIAAHGRFCFRHLKSTDQKAETMAELLAIAWRWFIRLAEKGKDATEFPYALAGYAARAVHAGRRLCGQERSVEVLSPLAQRRHGFTVSSLPDGSSLYGNVFDEALHDNTQSPVDEQVAFRIDFPAWRLTRTDCDRRLIDDLMVGEKTQDVAHKHGLSPGRVSQLRRAFHDDWLRFVGEAPQAVPGTSV
jgi:hypothetical protein